MGYLYQPNFHVLQLVEPHECILDFKLANLWNFFTYWIPNLTMMKLATIAAIAGSATAFAPSNNGGMLFIIKYSGDNLDRSYRWHKITEGFESSLSYLCMNYTFESISSWRAIWCMLCSIADYLQDCLSVCIWRLIYHESKRFINEISRRSCYDMTLLSFYFCTYATLLSCC